MLEGFNVLPREINVTNGKVVPLKLKVVPGKFESTDNRLPITVTNDEMAGPRYTTWPLEVRVDDQLVRTLRVAVTQGKPETAFIPIGELPPGKYRIAVGNTTPLDVVVPEPVWKIGGSQNFALATADWKNFTADADYTIGRSDSAKDWPFVQPGPMDVWGGSKKHTFAITFDLDKMAGTATGNLCVVLAQTHPVNPPKLVIDVNGSQSQWSLPKGNNKDLAKAYEMGVPYRLNIPLVAGVLKAGTNRISITTGEGNWMVYKSIQLIASGTKLSQLKVDSPGKGK